MKTTLLFFMIFFLAISECNSQQNVKQTRNIQFSGSVLEFDKQYSSFTDPGEYVYLYENFPDSLPELCSLIKSQFIHPNAELPEYREQIPEERWNELIKYPTVKSILEGLLYYDPRGFVKDRKPEDKLILGCREYAILLASVLKYLDIPARVRTGHAPYLIPGFHASHTICEVWNEKEKRWMLVDPGTGMVDFSRDEFDFSYDAWFRLQNKEIDPGIYGNPGQYTGMISIVGKVCPDLVSLLGNEYTVYQYAPILEYAARANTTTPFYTGDCLTTDQANFNGEEPYLNCENGINRKKPITVGSFSPNAFGLYDLHGNICEWTNDWYGEYNIDEKMNPKGPETGEIKVIRGGGFWNPGWRCRSACRAGDPPGNRGAGLSFRIVKDE